MISLADYVVLGVYLVAVPAVGVLFRRFTTSSNDYFAAGFRMKWWLVGASSFASNFSCWVFTGASDFAYQYGVLVFAVYAIDVLGFAFSYAWFAPRFRQLRLVTAVDGIRLRYGLANEQFFAWATLMSTIGFASVWLVGLSVVLGTVFGFPPSLSIVSTGFLVTFVALVGGTWSVAACDFVQLLLLAAVTGAAAVLTLARVGGIGGFVAQIPTDHWRIFYPAATMPFDWIYVVLGLVSATYMKNNLTSAAKYVAARNGVEARLSALVPLVGYVVMPVIWFLPPLAAYKLAPELAALHGSRSPGESAYLAVVVKVLPPGLVGLMVAIMYSTTVSNMNTALNRSAAVLVKNVYVPVVRPAAPDGELLRAGELMTLLLGGVITALAVILAYSTQVSLFGAFLYLNSYIGVPFAIPLFLGLFVRCGPSWLGWSSAVLATVLTVFLFDVAPLAGARAWLLPMIGGAAYGYVLTNKFVLPLLVVAPSAAAYYLGVAWLYRGQPIPLRVEEFFRRWETPVDFEAEVGAVQLDAPARLLGWITLICGVLVSLLVMVATSGLAQWAVAMCSMTIIAVGALLLWVTRRKPFSSLHRDLARRRLCPARKS